jgi:hypothetical protein
MKKLISAVAVAATLAACTSSRLQRVEEPPRPASTKRIAVVGNEVVLPDGSRSVRDQSGGFLLPNGDRVSRDARGALLLPNGNRCIPDAGGYTCP